MSEAQLAIPTEMEQYLRSQIKPGEQVLWAGTTDVPGRMKRLRPLVLAAPFGIFLCSFVFWSNPDRWLLVLLSLLIWAGIPAFVYWRQSAHLRDTLYAVTDRRALILSLGQPRRTESYPPDKIEFVHPVVKKSGRGDLYFTLLRGTGTRTESFKHGFLDIVDVDSVARLMRETLAQGQERGDSA